MATKYHLPPDRYIEEQIRHALGPVNRYFTAQEVHGDPDPDQCLSHWVRCGGADWFNLNHEVDEGLA